jgi:hypothetical protein
MLVVVVVVIAVVLGDGQQLTQFDRILTRPGASIPNRPFPTSGFHCMCSSQPVREPMHVHALWLCARTSDALRLAGIAFQYLVRANGCAKRYRFVHQALPIAAPLRQCLRRLPAHPLANGLGSTMTMTLQRLTSMMPPRWQPSKSMIRPISDHESMMCRQCRARHVQTFLFLAWQVRLVL